MLGSRSGEAILGEEEGELLREDPVRVGWSDLPARAQTVSQNIPAGNVAKVSNQAIAPAEGWVIDDTGKVTLVSYSLRGWRRERSPACSLPGF